MKYLQKCLIGLGVLLLAAAVLLWFLPARWVLPWIAPRMHGLRLQQVRGLVWNGRAAQVAADGHGLGQLQWTLSRRALFGQLHAQLEFHGPQLDFSGALQRLPDSRIEWREVSLHADLAALGSHANSPMGQPRGELRLTIAHALLQGGWPLDLQAQAQWQDAVMRTPDGDVALGDLHGQAQAQGGVIQAQWHDDGHGLLQVDGQLQLSPLGWRLDAKLHPRQANPRLRHWLAALGPADADGDVHIQRSGGLAGTVPAPPPTTRDNHEP
ncbi:MAG TPA: type II secretion system protein N [Rhodanobacter sp.]